jgi:murein DD-endopeptidase MepM/ murein hydrolase activator NlpD
MGACSADRPSVSTVGRIGGSFVAGLALVGLVTVTAGAAEEAEERRESIAEEVAQLEESIDEVGSEEQAIQGDLEETRRSRAELDAQLTDLDVQVADERRALRTAEAALDGAIARHLQTQDRLSAAQRDLAAASLQIREQAITAYMRLGSPVGELDIFLDASNLREIHGARTFIEAAAQVQHSEVERYRRLRAEDQELAAEAEDTRTEADARRADVVSRSKSVEVLRDRVAVVRDAVAGKAADEERLLAAVQARKAAFEQRVVLLRQESDAIGELLKASQVDQVPTPATTGRLGSPLVAARVTSPFGYRVHPIYGTRRLHAGIDFGAAQGTPILAAGDGTVVSSGGKGGYGNTVVIDHGGAIATLYAHQSRIAVAAGARVVQGQVIGYVGSTGASTGPHLQFEVRVNGTPVDPRNYL